MHARSTIPSRPDAATEFSLSQSLRRALRAVGDRSAVIDPDGPLSWNALGERCQRLAGALQQLGMQRGDRIAMLANNRREYLEYYYGVPWGGGIFAPLNFRLAPAELAAILSDADARILLVDDAHLHLLPDILPGTPVRHVIHLGSAPTPPGMHAYEALLSRSAPVEDAGGSGDDVVCLFYTSGSTGRPKGVMHTHTNLIASALAFAAQIGLNEDSVAMIAAPLFLVGAAGLCIPAMVALGTAVVVPRFDAGEALACIEQHRVTITSGVPTMFRMMIDHPDARRRDLSSMQTVLYGAAPMPEALVIEARDYFPNVKFTPCYGMTESTASVTSLPPRFTRPEHWHLGKASSVGRPLIGVDVEVVDADDRLVPDGTIGEIVVRGPLVMKGYWNQPELTAQTLRNGWLHTGDLGYRDESGFFHIVDRLKDMIIAGGENVYSAEVEAAIYSYPGVAQCAVIGIPDPKWGEAVHAIVTASPGVTLDGDALQQHCRSRIAAYKCPRSIDVRTGSLPLSGANKIDKPALRAPFWQGRASRLV
jgi:long-chain acyl-CoA synthetase